MELNFSGKELDRYSRHLALPGFSEETQLGLKKATVAVVGAGGLGSPVLLYLAAAGVGRLKVIDHDVVSESNLQRQILFNTEDLGKRKSSVAISKLCQLNPNSYFQEIPFRIHSKNAFELLSDVDVVADCSDNFPTRYLLNDACVLLNKVLVYGSVFRFEGQVSVFNYQGGCTYRDLYPVPPSPGSVMDCEQGGVLGTLCGMVGSLQANEVIKIATGIGEPLSGRLLIFDSATAETTRIEIPPQNQREKIKNLIDYDEFCGLTQTKYSMKEVTVQELKKLLDAKADFQFIDVREPHEYDICNLGAELIPQAEIPHNVDKISKDKQVIVHCRSGARSGNMVQWLEKNHGFTNLYNLKGGILAWAKEIDPSMPTY
ncbi:MAG TPA: ThiF family adenylyltransferase [Cyclobacteriaceae bacterium]|nr:ThiF family adenylyltransferase [Cyclobacteriaceae bacterium]